jgi:uncharacterized protein (DUF488 family)
MAKIIWTVGHSTRTIEEFVALLKSFDIEVVADVRTIPRSRKNPQFNRDELERVLPEAGIEYAYQDHLGGLRHPRKDSMNTGWRNDSFRGYADYMQTPAFDESLERLIELAKRKRTVIMCAEVLPWRCHRSLIADALLLRGFEVTEVFGKAESREHKMTPFAVVEGLTLTYPPADDPVSEP